MSSMPGHVSLPASPSLWGAMTMRGGNSSRYPSRAAFRRETSDDTALYSSAATTHNSTGSRTPLSFHPFDSSWLIMPSVAQNVYRQPTAATTVVPASAQSITTSSHHYTTPFLTIALLKLNEVLPAFCEILASSPLQAPKACALLESSVATARSAASSRHNSPTRSTFFHHHNNNNNNSNRSGNQQQTSGSPVLASRSSRNGMNLTKQASTSPSSWSSSRPILQWFHSGSSLLGGGGHRSTASPVEMSPLNTAAAAHSPASSALALEGEWDTYMSPFLLLAAAEYLYADMHPCQLVGHKGSARLSSLYQRIVVDLTAVKDILCDPILGAGVGAANETIATDRSIEGGENSPPATSKLLSTTSNITAPPSTPPTVTATTLTLSSLAPLSSSPPLSVAGADPLRASTEAAARLARTIDTLITIATCRSQLTDLQANLFGTNTNLGEVASLITMLWHSTVAAQQQLERSVVVGNHHTPTPGEGEEAEEETNGANHHQQVQGAAQPLYTALIQEFQTWKYCLETSFALGQCHFAETILRLRQWKQVLPKQPPETRLARWFHEIYERTLSLLPIYFDRIQAFAGPLYGFDIGRLMQGKTIVYDYDQDVLEFLRRQEKGGGPPMAIAIVLDAVRTANQHVERGFQLSSDDKKQPEGDDEEYNARVAWPAVYLRSTVAMVASAARTSSSSVSSSQGNLLQGWPSGSSVNSFAKLPPGVRKMMPVPAKFTVMEYGPDSGMATSWPHSEWEHLVSLLDPEALARARDLPPPRIDGAADDAEDVDMANLSAVTYRPEAADEAASQTLPKLRDSVSSSSTARSSISGASLARSLTGSHIKPLSSTFHIVALSDWISIVAIVKGEEQRWNRRRSPLTDEEIRSFLNYMASKLRVSQPFTSQSIPSHLEDQVKLTFDQLGGEAVPDNNTEEASTVAPFAWTDAATRTFLEHVKASFDLRPSTPLRDGRIKVRSPRLASATKAHRRSSSESDGGLSNSRMGGSRPYQQLRHKRNRSRDSRSSSRRNVTSASVRIPDSESAAIFFMGKDLAFSFS